MANEAPIRTLLRGFIDDPPDSDYQSGFLGAVIIIANEIMGIDVNDPLLVEANSILSANEQVQNEGASRRLKFVLLDGGKDKETEI